MPENKNIKLKAQITVRCYLSADFMHVILWILLEFCKIAWQFDKFSFPRNKTDFRTD